MSVAAATLAYIATAVVWLAVVPGASLTANLLGSIRYPDPLLNLAILEWGYRTLVGATAGLFAFPMGWPVTDSLASTENLLGWQLLYTPLRIAGAGPVLAYNAAFLAALAASGSGVMVLCRVLGMGRTAGFVAGFVFAFAPFHLSHMVHLQTLAICWVPFALAALERFLQTRDARYAAAFGALALITLLSGLYVGTFLAIVAALYVAVAWTVRGVPVRRRDAAILAAVAVTASLLSLPLLLPYLRFSASYGFRHTNEEIAQFSTSLVALLKSGRTALWSSTWLGRQAPVFPAFPGVVALALAAAACLLRDARRRTVVAAALLLVVTLVLSLGPRLVVTNQAASGWLGSVTLPGAVLTALPAVRFPVRMLLFAYVFGAVLVGCGVEALAARVHGRARRLVPAVVLAIAAEYWPLRDQYQNVVRVPAPLAVSRAYAFLAQEAHDGSDRSAVAEWPLHRDRYPEALKKAWFVYGSVGHRRRVTAYFGNSPLRAADRLNDAAARLPDEASRRILWEAGVTRYVVHRALPHVGLVDAAAAERRVRELSDAGLPMVHQSDDAVVFSLAPGRAIAAR